MHKRCILLIAIRLQSFIDSRSEIVDLCIQRGYNTRILCSIPKESTGALRALYPARIGGIPMHDKSRMLETIRLIRDEINSNDPILVNIFNLKAFLFYVLARDKSTRRIVIFTLTGLGRFVPSNPIFRIINLYIIRKILNVANVVIFQNSHDRNRVLLDNTCIKFQHFLIVSSGVNIERYPLKASRHYSMTSNEVRILMVGRLVKEKGVYLYAKIAKLFQSSPNIHFTWLGAPSIRLKTKEQRFVNHLKAHGVSVLPFTDKPESIYQSHDILCFTSTYNEGFPRVILEAMSSGLPVIAVNNPTIYDIVQHGTTGLIYDRNQPECAYDHIVSVMEYPYLRETLIRTAHRIVSLSYSQKTIAKQYSNIYDSYLHALT